MKEIKLIDLIGVDRLKQLEMQINEDGYVELCPDEVYYQFETLWAPEDCPMETLDAKNEVEICNGCWNRMISKSSQLYKDIMLHRVNKLARRLAKDAHKGQKDKSGRPYFEHVNTVAFEQNTDRARILALLHDVVENTSMTYGDIKSILMFDPDFESDIDSILIDLEYLTRQDGESYKEYIQAIYYSRSEDVVSVKLADLRHNMKISRLTEFKEKDIDRIAKYATSYAYLKTGVWLKNVK